MKNIGYKRIFIFTFINVFPLIIIYINPNHLHHLLLGRDGVLFSVQSKEPLPRERVHRAVTYLFTI
jgi:hypothetical protein